MYTILLVIHTIIVLFLIMMVLIQRTDSDGMGGLGGGGNQFMTGRATANLMTRTTAILAAAFMISSLVLAVYAGRMTGGSIVDSTPVTETAPVAPPAAKEKAPEPKPAAPAAKAVPAVPKPE